jgi:hypothetical protein
MTMKNWKENSSAHLTFSKPYQRRCLKLRRQSGCLAKGIGRFFSKFHFPADIAQDRKDRWGSWVSLRQIQQYIPRTGKIPAIAQVPCFGERILEFLFHRGGATDSPRNDWVLTKGFHI